ncbi:MAG TPA: SigB/SigF/SigG family RNA polymerase sigma factor [Polyangiaceae bacterium]|jgi:RNA polymerase sigma-B factor|nr:SigB/SigF/SigG family RNA polymerase sigma factor [Polyangiaceae bacterium]
MHSETHEEQVRAASTSGAVRDIGHSKQRERATHMALFARLRHTGEKATFDRLVECFTPLARTLARRYKNTSEPYEDLCQVAQLGLIKAIQRFDPERGFPFQAYAIPTILGELRRYFRNSSWAAHVPRGVQERALEVRDAERALNDELGRAPTVFELAQFMELSVEHVIDAMQALRAYGSVSLDAPRANDSHDEDGTYAETFGDEDPRFELVELGVSLESALATLEPRQREMLRMRYIEEMTQSQIAERIGVSQMQVSRLLRRCLAELRELTGAMPAEQ